MNSGEGMDIGHFDVAREIGVAWVSVSDVKFDVAVFEFVNTAWRGREE